MRAEPLTLLEMRKPSEKYAKELLGLGVALRLGLPFRLRLGLSLGLSGLGLCLCCRRLSRAAARRAAA